ncbi:MAG: hypothetical protein JW839_05885 [Candidatus Lokiarchaeota archaeon]|nr:hypothetical protein [Candidatus Lokiarchaeota archaeon]
MEPEDCGLSFTSWKQSARDNRLDDVYFVSIMDSFKSFCQVWISASLASNPSGNAILFDPKEQRFLPLEKKIPSRCATATSAIILMVFVHLSLSPIGVVIRDSAYRMIEEVVGDVHGCEFKFDSKKIRNKKGDVDVASLEEVEESRNATVNLESAMSWECSREHDPVQQATTIRYGKRCPACDKLFPQKLDDFKYRKLLKAEIKAAYMSKHIGGILNKYKSSIVPVLTKTCALLDDIVGI